MASQGLADLLAGTAGASINRPQLNAYVANSQAINGLRSAQTEDAMTKASQAQEQMAAYDKIHDDFVGMGAPESEASLMRDALVAATNHDPVTAAKTLAMAKLGYGNAQSQTSGQQMFQGKEAGPVTAPNNFIMPPNSPLANQPVQQSPQGVAQTAQTQAVSGNDIAEAELRHAQAKNASNPIGNLDPQTVHDGAQVVMADPTKMNQYAGFGQAGQNNKNAINNEIARQLTAAGMTASDMIRQRAIAKASIGAAGQAAKQAEVLDAFTPLVRANGERITTLLQQVGQDGMDTPIIAGLERGMGRQLGSPELAELHSVFTTYQNEVSRLLASSPTMAGVISDHARSEIEGMAPENMTTRQAIQVINRINTEIGIRRNSVENALTATTGAQQPVTSAPGPTTAPPVPGAPAAAPGGSSGGLPSYPDEASALAAGHKAGDRVMIGGVSGTLR